MLDRGAISKAHHDRGLAEWCRVQVDLVLALIERDVRSRFGETGAGYGLAFLAPLAWIGATYLAFWLIGRTSPVYADTITFIISGLIPYALFRYAVTAVGRARSLARPLMIYPTITEGHVAAAAAVLEFVNGLVLLGIVLALNWVVFGDFEMADPFAFLWGMVLCWALGASYAYALLSLSRINSRIQSIGLVLIRPTFFLSAILFTANELPERILEVLGWNPLLHAVEIARDGMLFHYESRVASAGYALACVAGLLLLAIAANATRRD